jgi:hypothetical protein
VLSVLLAQSAFASMNWGQIHTTTWQNPQCLNGQDCGLQEFNLRKQDWIADYSALFPEDAAKLGEPLLNYGTTVFYEVKTQKPEQLESFAVVSFIKGCMYSSYRNQDDTVTLSHSFARDLLGKLALYLHRDWHVDSIDEDPMYKNEFPDILSQPGATRFGRWEWTEDPKSFDQNASTFYRTQKPTIGRLFTSDRPGTAFRQDVDEAKNVSIQVRACIYPVSQVPSKISHANQTDFGAPLACHEWTQSKVFNHKTLKFETHADIEPVCTGEPISTMRLHEEGGAYFY